MHNRLIPFFLHASLVLWTSSGSVTVEPGSSVWYGAVVRGDVNPVTIGSNAHVMDNAVVHVAKIQGDFPTKIGENVVVGEGR